jgi:hypothetical protein
MHADRDAFEAYAAMTYSEVGAALGVSRSRVQQVEATALRKWRVLARIEELDPMRWTEIVDGPRGRPVYELETALYQLKRELSGALAGANSGALAGVYAGAHPDALPSGRVDAVCVMTGEGVLTAAPG